MVICFTFDVNYAKFLRLNHEASISKRSFIHEEVSIPHKNVIWPDA